MEVAEATVIGGEVVTVGSRVKHYGQRYTGCATATVVRLVDVGSPDHPWIKVLVEPDSDHTYGAAWDWDRTEVAADLRPGH